MQTKYIFLLLTILTGGVAAQPHSRSSPAGSIRGNVYLADGSPASFVTVSCSGSKTAVTADAEGTFVIPQLQEGLHTLRFRMVGHDEVVRSVEVRDGETVRVSEKMNFSSHELHEVVVTGQAGPQSLKNSVYQVRVIDSEKIKLRGATSLPALLNTELGIRFSNDQALGTTDIELLGMTGQSVKILLDGIPLSDRGEIRESLGQVDINSIERIEIVEGPMSVIYGTDALAGVINLITRKRTPDEKLLTVSARLQEETVNSEYRPLTGKGVHNENLSVTWQHHNLQAGAGITRNNFGGWQGDLPGRTRLWLPKAQILTTATIGFRNKKMNLWYRFNGTDERIINYGAVVRDGTPPDVYRMATDKKYTTWRWFHQLQGEYAPTEKLSLYLSGAFTDYSRRTLTTDTNLDTGHTTLNLGEAAQDKSIFNTAFGRLLFNHKTGKSLTLIGGLEYNFNEALGARIQGNPTIHDYALFLSPEIRTAKNRVSLRPGVRFIYNSAYDAPPVIPSINSKITITPRIDLRASYARGYRAPALRELYFVFQDSSHDIIGNPDLKAESSDSYNAFFNFSILQTARLRLHLTTGGFYNAVSNRIDMAVMPGRPTYSYFNINTYKTKGLTLNAALNGKSWQVSPGLQWLGRYNLLREDNHELPEYTWSPEINLNTTYSFKPIGLSIHLAYKYTGARPGYSIVSQAVTLTRMEAFHMADITLNKQLGRFLTLGGGVRNLFNVTNLSNTAPGDGVHSGSGLVPLSYGRSFFLGLSFGWHTLPRAFSNTKSFQ